MPAPSSRAPLPFVVIWRRAVVDSDFSSTQRLICLVLSVLMDAQGRCRVSEQTIARGAGLERRAVGVNLPCIESAAYVTVQRRRGEASRYFARLPESANLVLEGAAIDHTSEASEPAIVDRTPETVDHGTCDPGSHEVEKKEKIDDVTERRLRRSLVPLGPWSQSQFEEFAASFIRDPERFQLLVGDAAGAKKPIAALTALVRSHATDEPEQLSLEALALEKALKWAEEVGSLMQPDDADIVLEDAWLLSNEERETVRRALEESRRRLTGTDA